MSYGQSRASFNKAAEEMPFCGAGAHTLETSGPGATGSCRGLPVSVWVVGV